METLSSYEIRLLDFILQKFESWIMNLLTSTRDLFFIPKFNNTYTFHWKNWIESFSEKMDGTIHHKFYFSSPKKKNILLCYITQIKIGTKAKRSSLLTTHIITEQQIRIY